MAEQQSIRKRQQISSANKTMFLWVALASALIATALVVSYFLFQRLVFNEKVLAVKSQAASNLQHNNSVAEDLKRNVRVRNTSDVLRDLRVGDDDQPLQVVLDALPSSANSAALGASLQSASLLAQSGVSIESLTVDPVVGVEGDDESDDAGEGVITFQFQVSTDVNNGASRFKEVLQRLERSIRVITLTTLTVERQGSRLVMTAEGEGYYEPAQTLDLKKEEVEP